MSEAVDLEPCPFCGGAAEIWRATPGTTRKAWIACVGRCVVISKEHETDAEAVAAWNRRAPTGDGEPVAWVDRPALDIPALQREVAGIIVRDVLQEEYDDLVEGYLDEIMRASLRIIRLPGYSVVARAFETNLADALLSGGGE